MISAHCWPRHGASTHEPPRSRAEPTRSDAYEPVARWENEGGAYDERERTWPTEQMATGEPMNEDSSP